MNFYSLEEVSNKTGLSIEIIKEKIDKYSSILKHRLKKDANDQFILHPDGIKVLQSDNDALIERYNSRINALENILNIKQNYINSMLETNIKNENELKNKLMVMNFQIESLVKKINSQNEIIKDMEKSMVPDFGKVSVSELAAYSYYNDSPKSVN